MRLKPSHILLPVAVLIGAGLMAQKQAAGFLNFFIRSISLAFDGITPVLRLNIAIQNPSNESFVIRSLVANVTANETIIGNISSFTTVAINPNAETILPVFVRLKTIAIVSDILTLIQNGSGISQTIKIDGAANANNMVIPVKTGSIHNSLPLSFTTINTWPGSFKK